MSPTSLDASYASPCVDNIGDTQLDLDLVSVSE